MENVRIVHLSDLHFGVADSELRLWGRLFGDHAKKFKRQQKMAAISKNEIEIWKSLRDHLNENVKPHLILVTGDVVDTPDYDLYERAHDELNSLVTAGDTEEEKKRCFVCPGNH